ncbi:GDP-D-glucose phosphorylase 1-like [Stylophora pistillata]|uniref:GDP-D-glucose phosphorylase 1-like n=1 Tax=Stylophora pistillata TaxID=50429 RepID=UPI000C043CB1|nr:GDP-D-glucose phosphorylase 1-like [Stylophora pistillata]XP_022800396.1 GDP-D-glucose phosphorylase 1-like [Stylophora pistillata]
MNGLTQVDSDECSVLRVYLWPRNPVHGAKELSSYESEKRPIAVYEFAGSLAVETRKTFDSFTEENFVEYMARATLPEQEFIRHREAIRKLLHT